jgi:hypothetical protein
MQSFPNYKIQRAFVFSPTVLSTNSANFGELSQEYIPVHHSLHSTLTINKLTEKAGMISCNLHPKMHPLPLQL